MKLRCGKQGTEAFENGRKRSSNPYTPGSWEFVWWNEGWDFAESYYLQGGL
jgi:hypothetical protein